MSQVIPKASERRHLSMKLSTGLGILLLVIACAGVARLLHNLSKYDGVDWNRFFYQDLDRLKAGEIDVLNLYCTRDTDDLLGQIQGMPEVESLTLELTDATDGGMRQIGMLSNLRELVLYGGRPGIGDRGLAQLGTCPKLETLSLVNTRVTDEGLAALEQFPALSSLILYRDAFRKRTITDAGLVHLKSLPELRSLALTGGWMTDAGLAHLKGLATLRSLHLEGARITDSGLPDLKELRSLEHLNIRGTKISDAGVAELERRLPALKIDR
jgi:hypothetical protein